MPDLLVSVLAQSPFVAAFVWFAIKLLEQNSKRDEQIYKRDEQMQAFLKEQRAEDRQILQQLVQRFDTHDQKVTAAITTMTERTRPREEGK